MGKRTRIVLVAVAFIVITFILFRQISRSATFQFFGEVRKIVAGLKAQGYGFKTMSELLAMRES